MVGTIVVVVCEGLSSGSTVVVTGIEIGVEVFAGTGMVVGLVCTIIGVLVGEGVNLGEGTAGVC